MACADKDRLGYQTLQAKNGIEAIEIFKQQQQIIQLTIMDLMMPEMGGVQAAEHIHNIQANAKILFTTGYDKDRSLDDRHPLDKQYQVLEKPLSIEELSKKIRQELNPKEPLPAPKT